MSGIAILRKLLMKQAAKGSGQASGIMSIGGDVRKLADKKLQSYVMSAQKQGVDIDKLSEQELKYILELNKPKPVKAISAESAEGKLFTQDLMTMLEKASGKNVIKGDFGSSVTDTVLYIKTLEPMDAMKEANRVLKGEGRYKSLSKADRDQIVNDETVTDHIFERQKIDETEDFAQGGRTGSGLNYLLGEDDQNVRMPFKKGHSAGRRKFLKVAAGLATIPIVGKYFKWAKPAAKAAKVADLTSVPIKAGAYSMPAWFKPLVNKVIKEGEDMSGVLSTAEREIVHGATLPASKTKVFVTQDLTSGNVSVEIGMGKHGFPDGHLGQPVRLEYRASEVIEPNLKTGKGGGKTKEEFNVEEAEFTGGHPENVKFEESTFEKFGSHGSNFDEVEKFATGKVKKKKPLKKAEKTEYESGKAEADAEAYWDEHGDFASGGRVSLSHGGVAGMLGE